MDEQLEDIINILNKIQIKDSQDKKNNDTKGIYKIYNQCL